MLTFGFMCRNEFQYLHPLFEIQDRSPVLIKIFLSVPSNVLRQSFNWKTHKQWVFFYLLRLYILSPTSSDLISSTMTKHCFKRESRRKELDLSRMYYFGSMHGSSVWIGKEKWKYLECIRLYNVTSVDACQRLPWYYTRELWLNK